MKDEIKDLLHQSQTQTVELVAKGGAGLAGSFAAMSINDWAGLIVAVLTGVYMCFQIEAAWRNRKAAKTRQKSAESESKG